MSEICGKCGFQRYEHTEQNAQQCGTERRPQKGYTMNLHGCVRSSGFQQSAPRHSGSLQQGEGRFYRPQKQFS